MIQLLDMQEKEYHAGPVHQPILNFLTSAGIGTAVATGNYSTFSSKSAEFRYIPMTTAVARIQSLTVLIRDATTTFNSNTYGAAAVLTGGINVLVKNANGTILDITNGQKIYDNAGWGRYSSEIININGFMSVTLDFERGGMVPLRIDGSNGEYLSISLSDNFSNLNDHTFFIKGYYETAKT